MAKLKFEYKSHSFAKQRFKCQVNFSIWLSDLSGVLKHKCQNLFNGLLNKTEIACWHNQYWYIDNHIKAHDRLMHWHWYHDKNIHPVTLISKESISLYLLMLSVNDGETVNTRPSPHLKYDWLYHLYSVFWSAVHILKSIIIIIKIKLTFSLSTHSVYLQYSNQSINIHIIWKPNKLIKPFIG